MNKSLILLLVAALMAPFSAVLADEVPANHVRDFYAWYVRTLNENKDPIGDYRQEMRRFVTGRLLREIEGVKKGPDGLNGDYFVNAQDFDKEWEKNIAIENVDLKNDRGTMDVVLSGQQAGQKKLRVSVIKKPKGWKIDKVEGQ